MRRPGSALLGLGWSRDRRCGWVAQLGQMGLLIGFGAGIGCNQILGLKDIHIIGPDGATDASSAPDASDARGVPGTDAGDSGGKPSSADDASVGDAEDGSSDDQPDDPDGTPDGAAADAVNAEGSVDAATRPHISVRGTIVDSWRLPVEHALVTIGGSPTHQTDSEGRFQIDEVKVPYDVIFVLPAGSSAVGPAKTSPPDVWVFEGLDATTPTLQVRHPMKAHGWTEDITFRVQNGHLDAGTPGRLAFGAPDSVSPTAGGFYGTTTLVRDEPAPTDPLSFFWYGRSASPQGRFHLLRTAMTADGGSTVDSYTAYQVVDGTVAFEKGAKTVAFDLKGLDKPLDTGTLTVTAASDVNFQFIDVYVHFDDQAVVQVVHDTSPAPVKQYRVPKIQGSQWTYSVAAASNDADAGQSQIVHVHGLVPDAQVTLTASPPATLVLPPPDATEVDSETEFSWTGSPGVDTLHIRVGGVDNGAWINVVTTRRKLTVPHWPSSLETTVPGYSAATWWVEHHENRYASTSDIVGPKGYEPPFRFYTNADDLERIGPEDAEGSVSTSALRRFATAGRFSVTR